MRGKSGKSRAGQWLYRISHRRPWKCRLYDQRGWKPQYGPYPEPGALFYHRQGMERTDQARQVGGPGSYNIDYHGITNPAGNDGGDFDPKIKGAPAPLYFL